MEEEQQQQQPQPLASQQPCATGGGGVGGGGGGSSPETVSNKSKSLRDEEGGATPGPRKDREEWSESAINTLIDAYTAKYGELNGKGLRSKDWAEVVATINSKIHNSTKTVEHCRNKMDTLTKRYKSERKNKLSGSECTWPWYEKMEIIRGCSPSKGSKLLALGSAAAAAAAPSDRNTRAKRGRKMPTLDDLSALASDVQRQDSKNKSAVGGGGGVGAGVGGGAGGSKSGPEVSKASDTSFGSQSPSFLNFQTMAAVAAAAAAQAPPPPQNPSGASAREGVDHINLARSINELASSMRSMASSLTNSITGFAEVYAKVEISKMEIFKELELKRTQMQLDSQMKIATILSRANAAKRKRENSSDSE